MSLDYIDEAFEAFWAEALTEDALRRLEARMETECKATGYVPVPEEGDDDGRKYQFAQDTE